MSKDIKINFLNSDEEERYQKHLTLKEIGYEGQLHLKNSSVLCIGAGGLGSSVLLYLAAAGIGRIGIVDNDQVEKSNLQRQIIHETNTIGNLKIDSARERIKKFNPNCEILTFSERINPKNALELIKEFDVICDCSDNFGTRYLINDSCLILNKPLVFGSVQGFEGQVSVFNLYKNSPNLRDLLPESPSKNAAPSCAEYGVVGVSTGLIGILQVNEIIYKDGYFESEDSANNQGFKILNGEVPGKFDGLETVSFLTVVLHLKGQRNVMKTFDEMLKVSRKVAEAFEMKLLDDNDNPLTEQAINNYRDTANKIDLKTGSYVS